MPDLEALKRDIAKYDAERDGDDDEWAAVISVPRVRGIIAALEHAECVEMALAELVKRASDPDIEATAVGARIMLEEAIREARILLKGPDGA